MINVYIFLSDGYRDMLTLLLNQLEDIKIVGSSGKIELLESESGIKEADVILMGLSASVTEGFNTLEKIKITYPKKKILALTNDFDRSTLIQSVEAGADGFVLLNTPLLKLIDYIKEAYEGGAPMSPSVARSILNTLSPINSIANLPNEEFTTREIHTLRLLVKGLTYKEISKSLEISLDTVRSHIKNIYSKLDVNSKSEAIIKVLTGKASS